MDNIVIGAKMNLPLGKDYSLLFQQCRDTYGILNQEEQLKEEMGELSVAISHFHRGKTSIGHIADEIADVKIMLEQIIYIYKLEGLVDSRIRFKIEKLKDKLNAIPNPEEINK